MQDYRMDPFFMDQYSEEDLGMSYKTIYASLKLKSSHANDVSENIDSLVELKSICGEVATRVHKIVNDQELEMKNIYDTKYYEERKKWIDNESNAKTPPAEYFKSIARKSIHKLELEQNDNKLKLKRFQNTYDDIQERISAQKKRYDNLRL